MRVRIHHNGFVRGLLGLVLAMPFVQCGATQGSVRGGQSSRYLAIQSDSGTDGNRAWRPTRQNSIPATRNAAVEKWVQAFQGPLKKSFDRWFTRLGHYGPVIDRILDDAGVPRDLIYLAMIESGFNLSAYSTAAASGPWQFIASTGRMYGLDSKIVDERRDIESATRAAAAHLKDLYKIYGDWYLAFAAYNAGPGKVNAAIRQAGTTDYWKLASPKSRYLRQETKDYVPKLLAAMQIVKNYRHYGYTDSNFSQPLQYDRVVLTDATDIGTIAKCARTSSDVIREMNPALIRGITAPDDQTNVYLPKGASDEFRRNYAMIPPAQRMASLDRQMLLALAGSSGSDAVPAKVSYYKVRKGDTLKVIARKNKVSESKIASWNRLGRKSQLKVGMKLKIMKPGSGVMFAGGAPVKRMSGVASIISQDTQNPMDVGSVSSRKESNPVKVEMPTMVAKLGDFSTEAIPDQPAVVITDASDFADSTRFDVASIGLRGGETGSSVAGVPNTAAGMIPQVVDTYSALAPMAVEAAQSSLMQKPLVRIQHVVRRGETLQVIATQYRMTVAELKRLNNLKNNILYANQKLVVDGKSVRGSVSNATAETKPNGATRLHVVKTAETLSGIAQKYSMTMADVKALNNMSGSSVFVGQKLKVTGSGGAVASGSVASTQVAKASVAQVKPGQKYITHKIKSGETLWTLSKKYQVKILDIKKWNALTGDAVKPNQTLKIMAMNAPVASAAPKSAL